MTITTSYRNFTESDIIGAVATFNADPYCVEDEEMAAEIMAEIEEHGAWMVTDKEEREMALARLNLQADSERIVYRASGCLFSLDNDEYTYDIFFEDDYNSNNLGFRSSLKYCKDYIRQWNGTNHSYFEDYKGGLVRIVWNETGIIVYEETIL